MTAAAIEALHAATAIYTSSSVVEALLDRVGWPAPGAQLLDPAAGDGAFIVAALARLDIERDHHGPLPLPVRGYELHPGAVDDARARVAAHLRSRGFNDRAAVAAAGHAIRHGDFLTWGEVGRHQFIVGNPPYLRYGRLPPHFKSLYGEAVPSHARNDMLHAFLDRCVAALAPEGRVAFITADRWLFNENAADLREQIGQRVGLVHVHRVDARTAFYRPKRRVTGSPPRIHPVEVVLGTKGPLAAPLGRHAMSPDTGRAREETAAATLADVAEIRLAPWLGPEGIFVVDELTARALGARFVPVVRPRDVDREGFIRPRLVALLTKPDQRPSAAVLRHLAAAMVHMPPRGQRPQDRPGWWVPPERVTPDLKHPALLIPRISSGLRVIDLPAGVLPLNHAMTIVGAGDGPSIGQLRTYLQSEIAQAWVKAHAARIEGGFLSVTTKLLRRLPVPAEWKVSA